MDLKQLRYFVAVAEELSFRRAAERLNLSQPPLTVHVQRLEAELGVTLFHREKRRIRLTAAGAELLRSARSLLAAERRLAADVARAAQGEVGRLSMGFTDDFLYREAPRLATAFAVDHPGVRVESHLGLSADLAARVLDQILDVALICPPLPERFGVLRMSELSPAPIRAVLPTGHRLSDAQAITLADLKGENFIAPASFQPTGFFLQVLKLFDTAGVSPRITHETSSMELMTTLVSRGCGVALASAWSVPPTADGVVLVPLEDPGAIVKRAAISRPDPGRFVDHLLLSLADQDDRYEVAISSP